MEVIGSTKSSHGAVAHVDPSLPNFTQNVHGKRLLIPKDHLLEARVQVIGWTTSSHGAAAATPSLLSTAVTALVITQCEATQA